MIKRLAILLAFALSALAQQQQPSQARKPDCLLYFNLTQSVLNSAFISNGQVGCYTWAVSYISNGFSGETVTVQSAPDNAGVPGTWVTFVGTATVGANPMTAITYANVQLTGYNPWVRVNLSGLTGTGTVQGIITGFLPGASSSGGGGGGSSPNVHVVFASAASAAATVTGVSNHSVYDCYDTTVSPPQWFVPDHVQVTDANTLTLFFVPNATGYCNVSTGSGVAGPTGPTGPAVTPAGATNSIQVNNAGVLAGRCLIDSSNYLTCAGGLSAGTAGTFSGAQQLSGVTSGVAGFAVNDVAGASSLYLLPTVAPTLGQVLQSGISTTCPTLDPSAGSPTCYQTSWVTSSGGVALTWTQAGTPAGTLLNSWVNISGREASYAKGSDGLVHLRGAMTPGTTTNSTVIVNLPAGFRPLSAQDILVPSFNSGGAFFAWGWISIQTNGDIQWLNGNAASPGPTDLQILHPNAEVSLSSVEFASN